MAGPPEAGAPPAARADPPGRSGTGADARARDDRRGRPAGLPPGDDPPADRRGWGASLGAGFVAGTPLLLGIVPFALIYGAAARAAGLSLVQTLSMSLGVFAGSAQLVFVNLWAQKVAVPVLALTCLAVNLRLLIYGASLSLRLGPPRGPGEALLRSYILTDESYAVSMAGFFNPGFGFRRLPYYVGSGLPTWLGWQSVGAAGWLAGAAAPSSWPIGLAVPLIFLALLISILRASSDNRKPRLVSAAVAGLAAMLLRDLPLNSGLVAAVVLGVLAGLAGEAVWPRPSGREAGAPGAAPAGGGPPDGNAGAACDALGGGAGEASGGGSAGPSVGPSAGPSARPGTEAPL